MSNPMQDMHVELVQVTNVSTNASTNPSFDSHVEAAPAQHVSAAIVAAIPTDIVSTPPSSMASGPSDVVKKLPVGAGSPPSTCVPSEEEISLHANAVESSGISAATQNAVQLNATRHQLDQAKPIDPRSFPNPPRSGSNVIRATIPNLKHLLDSYHIGVRYDVIRKRLFISLPGHEGSVDNVDQIALTQIISLASLNEFQTAQIAPYLDAIGDRNPFNPVAIWITERKWDGVDRMPDLCATLTVQDQFPENFRDILLHRWLLSAVAAAMMPKDFRARGVFTLQGPQGIGKTTFIASLVDNLMLRSQVIKLDHHIDASNKDTLISAVSHWIVELGELESSLKKDIPRLKGFITAGADKMRRPYGRVDVEYPRRTVFCASVNDSQFLIDATGNSRFWTVPVTKIDFKHTVDMQQVFAQLYVEFKAGAQWWLTDEEEERLEIFNRKHRAVSAVHQRLLEFVDVDHVGGENLPAMSAIEVLLAIGIERPSNPQCKECAAFLREHFGDSKRNKSRDTWRVSIMKKESCDFWPHAPAKSVPTPDDDDLY